MVPRVLCHSLYVCHRTFFSTVISVLDRTFFSISCLHGSKDEMLALLFLLFSEHPSVEQKSETTSGASHEKSVDAESVRPIAGVASADSSTNIIGGGGQERKWKDSHSNGKKKPFVTGKRLEFSCYRRYINRSLRSEGIES